MCAARRRISSPAACGCVCPGIAFTTTSPPRGAEARQHPLGDGAPRERHSCRASGRAPPVRKCARVRQHFVFGFEVAQVVARREHVAQTAERPRDHGKPARERFQHRERNLHAAFARRSRETRMRPRDDRTPRPRRTRGSRAHRPSPARAQSQRPPACWCCRSRSRARWARAPGAPASATLRLGERWPTWRYTVASGGNVVLRRAALRVRRRAAGRNCARSTPTGSEIAAQRQIIQVQERRIRRHEDRHRARWP